MVLVCYHVIRNACLDIWMHGHVRIYLLTWESRGKHNLLSWENQVDLLVTHIVVLYLFLINGVISL